MYGLVVGRGRDPGVIPILKEVEVLLLAGAPISVHYTPVDEIRVLGDYARLPEEFQSVSCQSQNLIN